MEGKQGRPTATIVWSDERDCALFKVLDEEGVPISAFPILYCPICGRKLGNREDTAGCSDHGED